MAEYENQQPIGHARSQAAHDGAAAVSTLYNLLSHDKNTMPEVEDSAMFSLCMDANLFELRVH